MQRTQKANSGIGVVFYVSLAISLAIILWGALFTSSFANTTGLVLTLVVSNLSWFFMLAANLFLVFVVYLGASRYGKIRLGKEGDEPEFGRFSSFAMMFQAREACKCPDALKYRSG